MRERLAALETAENPYAEIAGQLTTLYAQKDAVAEAVFARLGAVEVALEAGLAARGPRAALDALRERLALRWRCRRRTPMPRSPSS